MGGSFAGSLLAGRNGGCSLSSFLSLCSFVNRRRCAGNADSPVSLQKGVWCCEDANLAL